MLAVTGSRLVMLVAAPLASSAFSGKMGSAFGRGSAAQCKELSVIVNVITTVMMRQPAIGMRTCIETKEAADAT
jgi:hypothetical protein